MRLALDTRTPLIQHLPALAPSCLRILGRKHVCERQYFLTKLLNISYERRRPHSADREADSFDRDFLVRGLRVSPHEQVYSRLLKPFYTFPTGNRGYSKDRGTTKAYRLRPTTLRALHAVYRSNEPVPVIVYDEDEKEVGLEGLEANGLPRSVAARLSVPSVLPIAITQIDHALGQVSGWIERFGETMPLDPSKPGSTTLAESQRLLHTSRKWVVSLGGLPNTYKEQSHGRLGPNGFHLITIPSRIRQMLLKDLGLVDYDLASCHWSIFQSLGRALGFATPKVDMYVDHKADWLVGLRHRPRTSQRFQSPSCFLAIGGLTLNIPPHGSRTQARLERYAVTSRRSNHYESV